VIEYRYLVFGLRVGSALPIPSLTTADSALGDPDVEIVEGKVSLPADLHDVDGLKFKAEGKNYFLDIEECGRFQLIGGRKIVVEADSRATPEQVNLFLLGSVFGTLLHQRGVLPFHCNAVEVGGFAFLYSGDSGAGKSTLAAYFVDQGYRLLADDLCALRFDDDGTLVAAPGVARLKLWQDTLDNFRRTTAGLRLVPWYDNKYEVPLAGPNSHDSIPVAGLYHLRIADARHPPGIHRVNGIKAANAVTANIYRRRLADLAGAAPFYIEATARIAAQVPIFTMNRNWGFAHFEEEVAAAESHMRQLIADATSLTDGRLDSGTRRGASQG
jgi:hypothetical protein